jgi:hypothetical protein
MVISVVALFVGGIIDASYLSYTQARVGFETDVLKDEEGVPILDDEGNEQIIYIIPIDEDGEEIKFSLLDFNNLIPLLTNGIMYSPYETVEDLQEALADPEQDVEEFVMGVGYGFYALAGGAVLTLIFGIFARKRVPYSIFDR